MRIGIVGNGFIGRALAEFFRDAHELHVYDKFLSDYSAEQNKDLVNSCDFSFIAVPTPTPSGGSTCDLAAVEDVLGWLQTPACIKATIPPGTLERLAMYFPFPLAYSPEFIGERSGHEWDTVVSCGFVITAGDASVCDQVVAAYQQASSTTLRFCRASPRTAELCKYMANCFLATKVAFANQFLDIANMFAVDFEELRQLWLLDPRVGSSHTVVTRERGFGGRCLPKDLRAIVAATKPHGGAPILEAVAAYNDQVRKERP